MDGVTQSSVAIAEESAGASEELAAQAASLFDMVQVLIRTVKGAPSSTTTYALGTGVSQAPHPQPELP